MVSLSSITRFLDETLKNNTIEDISNNGLQVKSIGEIDAVALAVDACMESFEGAVREKAQLLIAHHGISWNNSLAYITGVNYSRLRFLLEKNIALYVSHLPLDRHSDYGNNVQLFRMFGLQNPKQFGRVGNKTVGLIGRIDKTPIEDFVKQVEEKLGKSCVWNFGNKEVEKIAIISGRGSSFLQEAIDAGADVFLTGEVVHEDHHTAKDGKITVIAAGHHNTETLGVKAIGRLLEAKFNIRTVFISSESEL